MLRRLVSNQTKFLLYSKSMAKISELKEYACLREGLNEEAAAKAHQEYQRLCQQYNLTPEALTDLFKIINSEPELLKEYVTYESWLQDYEHLKSVWIKSPFFASGQTVQSSVEALKSKYPEVASYDTRHSERVKAYQTLENIFVKDGPTLSNNYDNKAVSRYLNEFQKRINGHLNELRNKNQNKTVESPHGDGAKLDGVDEIAKTLGAIYSKIQQDPAYVYGRIRHFLTVHKQHLGEIQPRETTSQIVTARSLEEGAIRRAAASDVADPLQEGNDVPAMIEEENNALRQSINYNFLPWINDRKVVFEAQAPRCNTLVYGALATVFGSYLLYKLYQGDATYTGLAVILGAAAFSFGRHRIGTIRNSFDYLVQMNIHRDGRTLDLFIQKPNNTIAKIEGVPVKDFKLHRGDYTFDLPENPTGQLYAQLSGKGPNVKLSDFRKVGVGANSWVATYGGDVVFVPMQYTGNSSILREVFKGKGLEA